MAAPSLASCKKAIKILEQFDRLARKFGLKIPAKRLQELENLRDHGTIKSTDLLAKLKSEFPGEFAGMTLNEIREKCGML